MNGMLNVHHFRDIVFKLHNPYPIVSLGKAQEDHFSLNLAPEE